MKKLLGIVILSLLLNSCGDPSLKATRSLVKSGQYDHWAQVFLAKSHNHGRFGSCVKCYFTSAGNTYEEASENAMKLCLNSEVAKEKPKLRCILDRAVGSKPEEERRKAWAKKKLDKQKGYQQISLQEIKSKCLMFGYKEGTEKLADCMKELYVKETQSLTSNTKAKRKIDPSVWDDLGKMSEDLLSGKSVSESLGGVSSSSSTRKITCFKTGEETGGLNKICRYDCVGNLVTTTIGAAQMCPIQIQR